MGNKVVNTWAVGRDWEEGDKWDTSAILSTIKKIH